MKYPLYFLIAVIASMPLARPSDEAADETAEKKLANLRSVMKTMKQG